MKDERRVLSNMAADAVDASHRVMPRFNGVILAANVARDPEQRISAHAIFSRVVAPLPFSFPARFYVIAHIRDLTPGEHTFEARSASNGMVLKSEVIEIPTDEFALIVLSVIESQIQTVGDHPIDIFIDDEQYPTGIVLTAALPEEEEKEEGSEQEK